MKKTKFRGEAPLPIPLRDIPAIPIHDPNGDVHAILHGVQIHDDDDALKRPWQILHKFVDNLKHDIKHILFSRGVSR